MNEHAPIHDIIKYFIAMYPHVVMKEMQKRIKWLAQFKVFRVKTETRVSTYEVLRNHFDKIPSFSRMDVLYVVYNELAPYRRFVPSNLALRRKTCECKRMYLVVVIHEVKTGKYTEEHYRQLLRYIISLRSIYIGWRSIALDIYRENYGYAPPSANSCYKSDNALFWRDGNDWKAVEVTKKKVILVLWVFPWYDCREILKLQGRGIHIYALPAHTLLKTEEFKQYWKKIKEFIEKWLPSL